MAGKVRNVWFEIPLLIIEEFFVNLGCVYTCNHPTHFAAFAAVS
jgi:hypothetical protein